MPRPTHTLDDAPDAMMVRATGLCQWVGISRTTLWRLTSEGRMPKPVKLTERITAWKVGDIRAWLEERAATVAAVAIPKPVKAPPAVTRQSAIVKLVRA